MGLFDGVRSKATEGAKTFAGKAFNDSVNVISSKVTNITDSIGGSLGGVAAESQSSGALDHRCKINVKPSDLSKLVANQPQNNGAMKSPVSEVVLGPKSDPSNILSPLFETNGVMFPYTPTLMITHVAGYEPLGFTHSNYSQQSFTKSDIGPITITGAFTASTDAEARYMVAAMHFFRTVTKMYFGTPKEKAGFPPPVLLLNYLGHTYNNVPVVVTSYSPMFDATTELVSVGVGDMVFSVPVKLDITIILSTQYNPYKIKNEFNLDTFRTGGLLGKGYI